MEPKAQVNESKQEVDPQQIQQDEKSDLKRKIEENESDFDSKCEIQTSKFMEFEKFKEEDMAYFKFGKLFTPPGDGAHYIGLNFMYSKYEKDHPEMHKMDPYILSKNKGAFTCVSPWLYCPFGYSIKVNEKGEMTNQLRLNIPSPIDEEKSLEFKSWLEKFDELICEKMLPSSKSFGICYTKKKPESKETLYQMMGQTVKEGKENEDGFKGSDYLAYKYKHQKRADGVSDQTIAEVDVYKWDGENDPEFITDVLTLENASGEYTNEQGEKYTNPPENIHIPKGCYVKVCGSFNNIWVSKKGDEWGIKKIAHSIFVATDSVMQKYASKTGKSSSKRICPFKPE